MEIRVMKIIPLSEGTFTIDKTKLFVPFDEDVHNLQQRPVGSLLVEIQPFVVITSKDHAGGVSMGEDHKELSFPNASYYLQERELNFAFEKGFPSFITEELDVLKTSQQVILLKEDEGKINDSIHYKITGAHSPFHQVFWIKENNKTIFFGGDDAPQLQQMKHRFVAKYDFDGKKAMELRRSWWEQGEKEKWTFLFYHDVKSPVIEF